MATLENIHKGEPITVKLERFESDGTTPIPWTTYDDVIVYIWTDVSDIKKFSRVKAGYTALTIESDNIYHATVPGSLTKNMRTGFVKLEIWTEIGGAQEMIVDSIIYNLIDALTKAES
jgi:hypothetical protein